MLFENLDKRIKEAAEQHHPAYDEKAWRKMEHLLNQHLPQQKDDRRRIIFFLLFFLLIGGGTFMVISKPWNRKPAPANQLAEDNKKKVKEQDNEKTDNNNTTLAQPLTDKLNKEGGGSEKVPINQQKEETIGSKTINQKSFTYNQKNKTAVKPGIAKNQGAENKNKFFLNNGQDKNIAAGEGDKKNIPPYHTERTIQPPINERQESKEENKIITDVAKQDEIKENVNPETTKADVKKDAKKNNKRKNQNGFSFSVSAGADVSKAGGSKTGKTTLVYGAGIGYTRNRFTLRTGVYASRKIYWAGPSDYKLLYSSTTYKFEGADADCSVIDIPVKLSYNFKSTANSNWFAGAGLSSYLMKRETYVYNYKTTWGNPYTRPWEVKNENKHYFSILSLSGGYTRRINNSFSISAEPYMDIPLTGIGEGKVHLNSGGVLMTLSVRPFRK